MIESPTPVAPAEPATHRGGNRRRWWMAGLIVVALLGGVALLLPSRPAPVSAPAPATSSGPAAIAPLPRPSAGGSSAKVPRDLLGLPGRVPTRGQGTFSYAAGRGKVLGRKGPLRRFRVAVEKGSNEDPAAFAAQVEATLGDKRSWIGNGQVRLQRVAGRDKPNFTVYLATRDTAGRMCRIGGVNITVLGRPYTSCRATGRVIINLDRWRRSAKPYVAAKVPLAVYRQYVINHETGHELGYSHEGCPKRGGPAPVMVQQTLTVRGCVPYAWPRRNNRRFGGPSL